MTPNGTGARGRAGQRLLQNIQVNDYTQELSSMNHSTNAF